MDKYIRHYVVSLLFLMQEPTRLKNILTIVNGSITSQEDINDDSLDDEKALADALTNDLCISNIKEGYYLHLSACHLLPQTINPEWFNEQ